MATSKAVLEMLRQLSSVVTPEQISATVQATTETGKKENMAPEEMAGQEKIWKRVMRNPKISNSLHSMVMNCMLTVATTSSAKNIASDFLQCFIVTYAEGLKVGFLLGTQQAGANSATGDPGDEQPVTPVKTKVTVH